MGPLVTAFLSKDFSEPVRGLFQHLNNELKFWHMLFPFFDMLPAANLFNSYVNIFKSFLFLLMNYVNDYHLKIIDKESLE